MSRDEALAPDFKEPGELALKQALEAASQQIDDVRHQLANERNSRIRAEGRAVAYKDLLMSLIQQREYE